MPETTVPRVVTEEAWEFARVEDFWSRFSPLTPYGRDAKDERRVLRDRAAIEAAYDATEAALALQGRVAGPALDRLAYHLKRLPRLPLGSLESSSDSIELVELFQIKKFLTNYRAVLALLDETARSAFELAFESGDLAALLDLGGSDPETFFIAETFHDELPGVRREIRVVDDAIADARRRAAEQARLRFGLDFADRDFLVLPHGTASGLIAACAEPAPDGQAQSSFAIEAYDGHSCIVRIQEDESAILFEERRSLLVERERELEEAVLRSLAAAAARELPRLRAYVDAIRDFDLALARALLCSELHLVRPDLGSDLLAVESGRFLPCAWECESLGLAYTPIDLRLSERAAVIFGSNMGGKTVALQSLLFFQILAQTGFFVPAVRFASPVHARIVYVGELGRRDPPGARLAEKTGRGLSGFGFEIRSFVEAFRDSGGADGAFIVFDEFARTTGSREAEAILSAVIDSMATAWRGRSLFATHFQGVVRSPGVRYLRMSGLHRKNADVVLEADEPLVERIRRINGMMRYTIIEEGGSRDSGSDAIAIAALLGLDRRIVERAAAIYATGE